MIKSFLKKTETLLRLEHGCIDSGGHSTQQVYEFATRMAQKRKNIYAIKGKPGKGPVFEYRAKNSKTHKAHRFYSIGVGTTKEILFDRLKLQMSGENYIHFSDTLEPEYFEQITAESPKWVINKRTNRPYKEWVSKPDAKREAPDCWRYGYAAIYSDLGKAYDRAQNDYLASLINTQDKEKVKKSVNKSNYLQNHKY